MVGDSLSISERESADQYAAAKDISRLGTGSLLQALIYPWALTDYLSRAEWLSIRAVRKSCRAALFVVWRSSLPRELQQQLR